MELERESIPSFYWKPHIPNLKCVQQSQEGAYSIGTFYFPSEIVTRYKENNMVSGKYYLSNEAKTTCILVHGWRMNGFERVTDMYLQHLLHHNWNVLLPILPYHAAREPMSSLYSGEFMISTHVDRTIEAVQQTVIDLRALIAWAKNRGNGNQKIVLLGVSLGGLFTNLTAVVEKHMDALISVLHPNSLSYLVWNSIPGRYIKEDFLSHGVTYEQLKSYWSVLEPSLFQPKVDKKNMLLLGSKHDEYVPFTDSSALWEAWGRPERIVYPYGHAALVLKKRELHAIP